MSEVVGWKGEYPCTYNEDDKLTVQEYPTQKDPVVFFTVSNYDGEEEFQVALGANSIKLLHYQLGVYLDKIGEEKYELA